MKYLKISGLVLIFIFITVLIISGCKNQDSTTTKVESSPKYAENKGTETETNSNTKDILASLPLLPGVIDNNEKGFFVDIIKAIDDVYTEGNIKINVYDASRALDEVLNGNSDFYLPSIRNNTIDQTKLNYATSTAKMGSVSFVVYSNVNKKLTAKMLNDAAKADKKIPFNISAPPGIESQFPFDYTGSGDVKSVLQKVDAGRIDGFIWAQEEADNVIKELKLKNVYRSLYYDFDDVFIIKKGDKGKEIDKTISECIDKLRASGKLEEIHKKAHVPYVDWQPADMGW